MPTGAIVWTKSKVNVLSQTDQPSGSFDSDSHGETQSFQSDDLEGLLGDSCPEQCAAVALMTIDGPVSIDDVQLRKSIDRRHHLDRRFFS